jgi:hypothetical protein
MSEIDYRLEEVLQPPFSFFISKNRRFFWLASLVLIASTLIFYFNLKKGAAKETDFIAFESLRKSIDPYSSKEVSKLKAYSKKYPELAAQVDSLLAKAYMYQKDVALASALTSRNALEGFLINAYYLDFSKVSFLIEQRQFGEALALTIDLQKKILEDASFWREKDLNTLFGADLVLFNQFRIAMIFKEMGNASEELAALTELKNMIVEGTARGFNSIPREVIERFESHFLSGQLSLLDFIAARERILQQ